MKILLSNWINLLGIFLAAFICCTALTLADANLSYNIIQAMLASLFAILGYGMMLWALLILLLFVLDLVLIIPSQKNLRVKLIMEWLIISSPFIYWTFKYAEWIFAVLIAVFLITQLLRARRIEKIIRSGNE